MKVLHSMFKVEGSLKKNEKLDDTNLYKQIFIWNHIQKFVCNFV